MNETTNRTYYCLVKEGREPTLYLQAISSRSIHFCSNVEKALKLYTINEAEAIAKHLSSVFASYDLKIRRIESTEQVEAPVHKVKPLRKDFSSEVTDWEQYAKALESYIEGFSKEVPEKVSEEKYLCGYVLARYGKSGFLKLTARGTYRVVSKLENAVHFLSEKEAVGYADNLNKVYRKANFYVLKFRWNYLEVKSQSDNVVEIRAKDMKM